MLFHILIQRKPDRPCGNAGKNDLSPKIKRLAPLRI